MENSIAIAILFLGILIIASSAYTTYENGSSQIAKAREEQLEMKEDAMKTKIEITNVSSNKHGNGIGKGSYKGILFNVTNTGDITLNPCNWSYFIDGKLAQDYKEDGEIEIRVAEYGEKKGNGSNPWCELKPEELVCNGEDEDDGSYAVYPRGRKLVYIGLENVIELNQPHRFKIVTENGVSAYAVVNYTAGCPV